MTETAAQESKALVLANPLEAKQELGIVDPQSLTEADQPDQELDKQADDFVKAVLNLNPEDPADLDTRGQNVAAVETMVKCNE